VTETWLNSEILDSEILPRGYNIYRKDRGHRGGGVLLAVNSRIPCKRLCVPVDVEAVTVQLSLSTPIFVCVLYIPPQSSNEHYKKYFTYIYNLSNQYKPLIIAGDFNLPDIDWCTLAGGSAVANEFCNLIFDLNLFQYIDQPTHIQGNTLDLILSDNGDIIHSIRVVPNHLTPIHSDHHIITCNISVSIVDWPKNVSPHYVYVFGLGDYPGLCSYLHNKLSKVENVESVEEVWSIIKEAIISGVHKFIPKHKRKTSTLPVWCNGEIKHQINCLRTLRKKTSTKFNLQRLLHLQQAEDKLQQQITNARVNYESKLVTDMAANKNCNIYRYINNFTKSKSLPESLYFQSESASEDLLKAELFNKYFYSIFTKTSTETPEPFANSLSDNHNSLSDDYNSLSEITIDEEDVYTALSNLDPTKATGCDGIGPKILKNCVDYLYKPLHYLFTKSLHHCHIPTDWATHIIVPVYKSGERSNIQNYRPISLLSNISKVLERIIYDKIITFVSHQITPYQFGALKGRSTVQQLLILLEFITNSTSQTDVIYLDIKKAFDTIPHKELLDKIYSIGISGKLWEWFKCYLSHRKQRVQVNSCLSSLLPVVSGVPQGSILGPLLFIIYMNDLPSYINYAKSLMFVDDTKCYRTITSPQDNETLQNELNSIVSWSRKWNLSFNPNKSVVISYKPQLETSYNISTMQVATQAHHKDLGVIFSQDMSWDNHYKHILSRAYRTLGLLRRTFSKQHLSEVKRKLYLSLVRSQLTYCSTIWRPYLIKDIKTIEQLQRRATKFILNDYESDYYNRLLRLNLLPIMYIFELSDIMFAIKSLKAPSSNFDITKYISFNVGPTRSASQAKLKHVTVLNNKARHSYFNRLPRLWNALPPIDLSIPVHQNRTIIYKFLWSHFISNFRSDNPCSYHFLCPCSKCTDIPHPPNFK